MLKNVTVRHAKEHDVYVLETDGYLLDRDKFFYAGEYGALMFASDHGLTENCEGVGNGDSAVYPAARRRRTTTRPRTRRTRATPPSTRRPRLNQKITRCDLHHNNMATSGTMGNAVHIVHNNFYGNTAGIVTDSFYAGGHPGFPQSGAVFEKNNIYSNNFNDYHCPKLAEATGRVDGRRAARHRRPDRGRQRRHRPRQPHLRQLAPRHDAARRP